MAANSSISFQACKAVFTGLFCSYILLVPFFISVFYVGYQRWRNQSSVSTSKMMSHSDFFTYNLVALELINVFGFCLHCDGIYTNHKVVLRTGIYIMSMVPPGQVLFNLLTCVDRYLAVVHPIEYLGLRQTRGVRIRNMSTGCVWLISILYPIFHTFYHALLIMTCAVLLLSSIVVTFFSLSVLCALNHPGPGEVGGKRKKIEQSKLRAFQTVMIITGVVLLRLTSQGVFIVLVFESDYSQVDQCVLTWSIGWLSVPNSLVLPLLFLHRAGKLPGCGQKSEHS